MVKATNGWSTLHYGAYSRIHRRDLRVAKIVLPNGDRFSVDGNSGKRKNHVGIFNRVICSSIPQWKHDVIEVNEQHLHSILFAIYLLHVVVEICMLSIDLDLTGNV